MKINLMQGDCLERMKEIDDNSVDSIVTDPPYGLSFMGKHWDKGVPSAEIWAEALRVLKPGGHLLAFAGTRTQHRMAVNIEDAGFEIRDMIAWVYGSGFPKSLNVSKAIDKAAGAEGKKVGVKRFGKTSTGQNSGWNKNNKAQSVSQDVLAPATDGAKQWDGWGTALKPALEPITVARKPFKGTVAANVLENGTGAINIDGCRVEHVTVGDGSLALNPHLRTHINGGNGGHIIAHETERRVVQPHAAGRWPANLIHDGSDEVVELFPANAGAQAPVKGTEPTANGFSGAVKFSGMRARVSGESTFRGDSGSAARFFYCAKASKKDRGADNKHPTVKPTDLMRYLCRLVTPPNGIVVDPFMGSGSTGKAAVLEGFSFVGIELESESFDIAKQRINEALK